MPKYRHSKVLYIDQTLYFEYSATEAVTNASTCLFYNLVVGLGISSNGRVDVHAVEGRFRLLLHGVGLQLLLLCNRRFSAVADHFLGTFPVVEGGAEKSCYLSATMTGVPARRL